MSSQDLTPRGSTRNLMDNSAFGNPNLFSSSKKITNTPKHQNFSVSPPATGLSRNKSIGGGNVTYRELLGGFLHPRDMRKLVTPFSASNEPELIVRRHAMLLNFDPLRAIILRDRLLVLVPQGADSILAQLEQMVLGTGEQGGLYRNSESQHPIGEDGEEEIFFESVADRGSEDDDDLSHIKAGDTAFTLDMSEEDENFHSFGHMEWAEMEGRNWIDLPFELQSVDAILNSVCSILADDVLDLQLSANHLITELLQPGSDVGDHAQEVLRTMKNSVKEMMSRVNGFCRAMDNLLEDYEDMALMNLSRLLSNPDRFIQPVSQAVLDEESDEPELILEAHLQRGHTLTNALTLVQGQIHTTEDFAVRKSDSIRNRLLFINMMISILSLSVAGASLVGSLFGMNVSNPLEESSEAFVVLSSATVGGSVAFVIFVFCLIQKSGALPSIF